MAHRHTRTEVGVGEALRGECLQEHAHHGVASRVPSSGDDADAARLLAVFHLSRAVFEDAGVDVEAIDGVNAQGHQALGVVGAGARRRAEEGHVDLLELRDVVDHLVGGQFEWFVLVTLTAYYACNLKIGGSLKRLDRVTSDVAVANYGGSDFLHRSLTFCYSANNFRRQKYIFSMKRNVTDLFF